MSTTTLYFDLDFSLFSGRSGSCADDIDRDLVVTALRTSSENSAAHVSNVTVASVVCLIDTENIQGVVTSSAETLTLQGRGFVGDTSLYSLTLSNNNVSGTFDVTSIHTNETELYVDLLSNETELFENFTSSEDATLLGTLKVSNAVSGDGDTELSIDANVATLVYISDTRTSSSIDVSSSTANILIYGAGFDNINATVSAVLGYEDIYKDDGTTTLYTCPCTSQYITATSITIAFSYLVLEDASVNTSCTTCTLVVSNVTYEGISIGNGTYVGETLSVVETVAVNVIQSNDNGTVTIFGSGFGENSSAYSVTLSAAFLGESETTTSCDGENNIADGASVTYVSSHEIVVRGIYTASCNGTLILDTLDYILSGTWCSISFFIRVLRGLASCHLH